MKIAAEPSALASSPADAVARWPADRRVAAVLAGDRAGRTRFSLVAEPTETRTAGSLAELRSLLAARTMPTGIDPPGTGPRPPFGPGWIASIGSAVGFEIEPTTTTGRCIQDPPILLARIDRGWIHDNRSDSWTPFGGPEPPALEPTPGAFELGPAEGLDRRRGYEAAVARVIELIRAGDAFQVNITHALSAAFAGSPRGLFGALARRLAPWHGCYLEDGDRAIASASPELFLRVDAEGRVETRPMKGTRPGGDASLAGSPKDAAELAMIVDLMRNDLGRVCRFGSVRVPEARAIEPHGADAPTPHVWQGVATVSGQLRDDRDLTDLLRAAFPPGSVTGAPKVRAMQIINELEPALGFGDRGRGAYCGALGFIGDDGSASLAVAIRTALIEGGVCRYPVGAGIVADSEPASEWTETLVKARPFLDLCAAPVASGVSP